MSDIIQWLRGKKSYMVMGATIVYAIFGVSLKFLDWNNAIELILGASGLGALRNALPPSVNTDEK